MKVKELAKELGISKEEIIDQLRNLFVDAEDGDSQIDDKIAALIRVKLGKPKEEKKEPAKKKKAPLKRRKKVVKKEKKEEEKEEKKKKEKERPAGEKQEKEEKEEKEKKQPGADKDKKLHPKGIKKKDKIEFVSRAEPEEEKEEEKRQGKMMDASELVMREKKSAKQPRPKKKKGAKKTASRNIEIIEKEDVYRPKKKKHSKYGHKKQSTAGEDASGPTATRKTPQKIEVQVPVSVRDLAPRINVKPNAIIQYLMGKGLVVNINMELEEDAVRDVLANFGYELTLPETIESIEKELVEDVEDVSEKVSVSRAPVVTFMGHVDHGKTSLLDYIRDTMVTKGEKGGITQHIGAYRVETEGRGAVTFLDTPGHAAFTAMRARGATATDVVVLVVAADDGVMPQTKEAIDHARAAGVPILVAINKCDLPGADPARVKTELQKEDLVAEEWGGSTIMVEVSAATGEGVDDLVEMLMLESEMLELRANPAIRARGVVIEGKKNPGQGIVVTLLVQNGTLHAGDVVLCGQFYGKVKAMINDKGDRIDDAKPSIPVEILGLQGVPQAGEEFFVVKDEKRAKTLSQLKQDEKRKDRIAGDQRVSLEDIYDRIAEGSIKELKIILKADVQGSVEALQSSLKDLATSEVKVNIIHSGIGNINESDAMLAAVSNAVIIGFHVKTEPKAEEVAKRESLDIHLYDVIYKAMEEIKAAMEGLLEPEEKEVYQGAAEVVEVFPAKIGKAAGCKVIKGVIHRNDRIRIKRGKETVHEGVISSLKRFRDDVREVKEGFECGISFKGFNDIKKKDIIEAYIIEKVARKLQ
jgi:translation initiation factor IF-2